MAQKALTKVKKDAIAEDILLGSMTQQEIAEKHGVSRGSVSTVKAEYGLQDAQKVRTDVVTDLGTDGGSLKIDSTEFKGNQPRWLDIKNPRELLKHCDVDADVWMVDRCRVSSSEVTMKLKKAVGKLSTHKPVVYTNVHVSIQLKRRMPSEQATLAAIERLRTSKIRVPKVSYKPKKEGVLLEWCPYDHHHGLLAWAPEVDASWDLKISEEFFDKAATDVIRKASMFNVERIIIPFGQDWFHCNDPSYATPAAKHRLDMEGRLIKVFETGYWSLFRAIERFRQIAPVDIVWVPGNHDPETSYYLARALAAHYMDIDGVYRKGVTVDYTPRSRKVYLWGTSCIGFSHPMGRALWERQRGVFAELFPKEWAAANHHEIHTGHLHKVMELEYMQADTAGSHTVVRMLPSLCASDKWHHEMGFLDKNRASASFIWTKDAGLSCQFTTRVKT